MIKHIVTATVLLSLAGALTAQAGYSPLPRYETFSGYDRSTGDFGYEYYFGRYPAGRFQLGDGNFHNTLPIVTRISYRPHSTRSYSSSWGMGRTWSNVTIDMANTSLATMKGSTGRTWSTNHSSTPARVFSAAVTWPTRNGVQSGTITNWSQHTFLFSTPWVRATSGNLDNDFLADYQFTGGKLQNNGSWTTSRSKWYYLDGYYIKSLASGQQVFYHDTTTGGCSDSRARPPFTRAYNYMTVTHYSPNYRTTSLKNKMRFSHWGVGIGPSRPYVARLGLSVNASGTAFGAGCEKLYIAGPIIGFPGTTNSSGWMQTEYFGLPNNGLLPANPAFVGMTIVTQDTWNDTVTNASMITAGCSVKVPALGGLDSNDAARRMNRYHYNGSATSSFSAIWLWANPICKYN